MNEHFIILGLPRSMTAWVSCFLTCGDVFCQHDPSGYVSGENLVKQMEQPFPVSGICDTGGLFQWMVGTFMGMSPRYAFIQRDKEQAMDSFLASTDMDRDPAIELFDNLSAIAEKFIRREQPEIFTFDELQTEEGARRLWEYVAPSVPLPPAHLAKMMTLKVTVHPKVYAEAAELLNSLTAV